MTWVKILRWSVSEISPMKKAIAPAALIIILMTKSSLQFHEIVQFFSHRDAIAYVLCVERDLPSSCCAGTCHLVERVNRVSSQSGSSPMEVPVPNSQPLAASAAVQAEPDKLWNWPRLWAMLNMHLQLRLV
jgi:hypothetical protein